MDVNEGDYQLSRRTKPDFYAQQLRTIRERHCQSLLS